MAKYTFTEQCEEVAGLQLEDGTIKIFLNMTSKNGRRELVSLLQYMKETDIHNPEITVKDERIIELDAIVTEVKESEEWEAVRMNILEIGIAQGKKQGKKEGLAQGALLSLISLVRKNRLTLEEAAEEANMSVEEFEKLLLADKSKCEQQ